MRTRVMSTCFLVLVLLNGVTGSILAAVFCPNIPGVMTCCSVSEDEQNDHMDGHANGHAIRDSVGFESAEPWKQSRLQCHRNHARIASHTLKPVVRRYSCAGLIKRTIGVAP